MRAPCFQSNAGISLALLALMLVGWMGLSAGVAQGQFLRLTFEIESELEAFELNPLNFGRVVPEAGVIRIPMGDPNMGTYSITGPQNIDVHIQLEIPEFLQLGDNTEFRVPMSLQVAYANRNENNVDHAVEMVGNQARFPLRDGVPPVPLGSPAPSATAFLYVFGEIVVGDIPPGFYEAEVNLSVEY